MLWVRETARVVQDVDGECSVLIVCEDITEAHQLSQQLSYHANHDALTRLVNRGAFEHHLGRLLAMAQIEETQHALCYLDLASITDVTRLPLSSTAGLGGTCQGTP